MAILAALVLIALLPACPSRTSGGHSSNSGAQDVHDELPFNLEGVRLDAGEKLRVVATTGIVADVVLNVGGDAIHLTNLMPIGADPHSFTATPEDLRALNDAHVIFINGLNLEESLLPILENLDNPIPLVSVNAGVETLTLGNTREDDHDGEEADHKHGDVDPHTWFSVPNVMEWTENIETALSQLDPGNVKAYRAAAAEYTSTLRRLDEDVRSSVNSLPKQNRLLVTDHVALSYLANEYEFTSLGSVLPSLSTLASASAKDLAELQQSMQAAGVKALFVSTTVNPQTAEQLANDMGIPVVAVYTGSLSDADGPAPSYVELMRYDIAQIVNALQ